MLDRRRAAPAPAFFEGPSTVLRVAGGGDRRHEAVSIPTSPPSGGTYTKGARQFRRCTTRSRRRGAWQDYTRPVHAYQERLIPPLPGAEDDLLRPGREAALLPSEVLGEAGR